ncbi:MAG TPA: hypothetical protein VIJ29_04775 [Candidatus Paceibacterota bacterium]
MNNLCISGSNAPPNSSSTQKANAKANSRLSTITAHTGCSNGARGAPNRSMQTD